MSRGAGLLTLAVVEMRYPTQVNVSEQVVDLQQLEVGLIDAETIKSGRRACGSGKGSDKTRSD